jgi:protein gp37
VGKTSIEWTDASWNPIVGCTEVSPGCANCYAARLASTRLRNLPDYAGLASIRTAPEPGRGFIGRTAKPRWTGKVRFLQERLEEPLHWKKPRRIFVCDMGDLFHEDVDIDHIVKVLDVIDKCPQHTFQILTKRADRMNGVMRHYPTKPNVWMGTSVENQAMADKRIPLLLDTPAAVRFLSCEPLLGPVEIYGQLSRPCTCALKNSLADYDRHAPICPVRRRIDWIICGGESGPHARAMHPEWARSLRDQCQAAGVPFFFKQWGEWAPCDNFPDPPISQKDELRLHSHPLVRVGKKKAGRLLDGREWNEFPASAS